MPAEDETAGTAEPLTHETARFIIWAEMRRRKNRKELQRLVDQVRRRDGSNFLLQDRYRNIAKLVIVRNDLTSDRAEQSERSYGPEDTIRPWVNCHCDSTGHDLGPVIEDALRNPGKTASGYVRCSNDQCPFVIRCKVTAYEG